MKKNWKRYFSGILAAVLVLVSLPLMNTGMETVSAVENTATIQLTDADVSTLNGETTQTRTSVHDPSIVDGLNGYYYVFGSHMGVSKSTDLENWTSVTGESTTSTLFGNAGGEVVSYNDAFTSNAYTGLVTIADADGNSYQVDFGSYNLKDWISSNSITGNMWAPDVIYNTTLGKWCMYLSLNGATWNSSIALLTADSVEGPYVYQGPVVFSGFSTSTSTKSFKNTDLELVIGETDELPAKYNKVSDSTWGTYWPHAIDPCVFYDADGKLWMSYGSWSGGIYTLELDESTGLRDYTVSYADTYDELGASLTSDPYFGTKIAGGYYVSGEGSYINRVGNYYYLYMSYGFYSPEGGYNMRIFRSSTPNGTYVDANGNSAIFSKYIMNYSSTNTAANRGMKLMGNYKWNTMDKAEVAQGHNSAFVDTDGKAYVVYHTKFADGTASHELRVHQLFTNADGWLVAAPYEYAGETLSETGYASEKVTGDYDLIIHKFQVDYSNLEYVTPVSITLNADGTITGEYTGTWTATAGTPYVTLNIGGVEYKGVFTEQVITGSNIKTMCFSAVSAAGVSIWGSGEPTDDVVVAQNAADDSIVIPANTYTNITLTTEGLNGAFISWKSSNTSVLSDDGTVTLPNADTIVTLTKTIFKGDYYYSKDYQVTVKGTPQNKTDSVVVGKYFTSTQQDLSTRLDGSLQVPNPFYKGVNNGLDLSGGATIEFDVESTGDVRVLATLLAFLSEGGSGGRLYFTPGSYLGYNANGSYYDANINNYSLVKDYIGANAHVSLEFTSTGFTVKVNDVVAYTEEIIATDNGAGTVTDYTDVLDWLANSADTLSFGSGSWWKTIGADEANAKISNVVCTVGPIQDAVETLDSVFYQKDQVVLATNGDITTEANPFYGKNIKEVNLEYTINFADAAAMNGWDGIFSFYNSTTGGRISIQSAPYLCYNEGTGNWMDINQPGATGATDAAAQSIKGTDYRISLNVTSEGATFKVNGEEIAISVNGSGADYEDLIAFLTSCDQLTWGVGQAKTAYWYTELCTLSDIVLASGDIIEVNESFDNTTLGTNSDLNVFDNPFYGLDVKSVDLSFLIKYAENAAKNGWDGVFSFYNSATGGRVSLQTNPYLCYNDGAGNWMDINNPNLGSAVNLAATLDKGVDHSYDVKVTSDSLSMTVNGTNVAYAKDGSGATYADMLEFISTCDQFTIGVGSGKTSYWGTELCDLSNILVKGYALAKSEVEPEEPEIVKNPEITAEKIVLSTASDSTIIENSFKNSDAEAVSVEYTVNFSDTAIKSGWDGLFSFYNSTTGGRVSFQSAPYICYNDMVGSWIDINQPGLTGATNAITNFGLVAGVDYTFQLVITADAVKGYLNGIEFPMAANGSGAGYGDLIKFIKSCDQFTWGVGAAKTSFWNTELCTLTNVKITSHVPATQVFDKTLVTNSTASALEIVENPYFEKELDALHLEYTINWSTLAAKNGWDGLFSFYNSTTGGRVSVQSGAYICYNDNNGSWMDINQPGAGGTNAATDLGIIAGVDVPVTIDITKDEIVVTVNGSTIKLAENGSGATYSDLLEFIASCDQLSFGVGQGTTAYWWTELCTLSNIKFMPAEVSVTAGENGSVTFTGSGSAVTATAIPAKKYEFAGWYSNGILLSTATELAVSACKDVIVTAEFKKLPSKISAEYKTLGTWGNYVIGQVTITNVSSEVLKSWSVDFAYTGKIQSLWGARLLAKSDGIISVSAPKWSKNLQPGASATFQFIAKIDDKNNIPVPSEFELTSDEVQNPVEIKYEVVLKKTCQWNKGYNSAIIIKNTGETMIDEWTLEFDYADEITSVWGGKIVSHVGTHYVIENAGYNSEINPGESLAIGFMGKPAKNEKHSKATLENVVLKTVITE